MSRFSKLYTTTAFGLILSASSAYAELSNKDVWENLTGYLESSGYEVNATQSVSGDVLTVSDIVMRMEVAQPAQKARVTLPDLTFTSQQDGSVKISMPARGAIQSEVDMEGAEDIAFKIDYIVEGLEMLASGDKSALDYTYSADHYSLILDNLVVDDKEITGETLQAKLDMDNVSAITRFVGGALLNYTQSFNIEKLAYDVSVSGEEDEGKLDMQGVMHVLTSNSVTAMPKTADVINPNDMAEMLKGGFDLSGELSFQSNEMNLLFEGPEGNGRVENKSGNGVISASINENGMNMQSKQQKTSLNAMFENLPFPVSGEMAFAEFNFAMPVIKSDAYQDIALGITLGDLSISDVIWNMLDPGAQISHEPATLSLDLSGKAKLLFDLFDPVQVENMQGAAPGEIDTLAVNSLELKAAGAHLTGSGNFEFDNSIPETAPQPSGMLDLKLVGGNALLDNLVAMGWLPEQQAMGARMMMGLLAQVGEGEDTMTSRLEYTKEGHVLANGQRIQ